MKDSVRVKLGELMLETDTQITCTKMEETPKTTIEFAKSVVLDIQGNEHDVDNSKLKLLVMLDELVKFLDTVWYAV